MDTGDLRVDTVELLIGVAGHGHDGRVLVGCPSGIAVAVADFGTGEGEDGLDLVGDVPFARLDARALRGCDENLVVGLHLDGGEVCRGLDDAFEVAAHRDNAVGSAVEGFDEAARGVAVDAEVGGVDAFHVDFEGRLDVAVFGFDLGGIFVEGRADELFLGGVDADNGVGCARNGVAEVAAVEFADADLIFLHQAEEEAGNELVGVGAAEMDVAARVAALAFLDRYAEIEEVFGGV